MSSEAHTSAAYIKHHLQNLTYGQLPDGSWGIAHSAEEAKAMGFWALNLDTFIMSLLLGAAFLLMFRSVAKSITAGIPGGLQNFCEWALEFVDNSVRGSFTGKNNMIGPLALTIFFWVFSMNLMDLLPIDYVPLLMSALGVPFFKIVPSTDPNATFGMAIGVFVLVLYYSVKMKGSDRFDGRRLGGCIAGRRHPVWFADSAVAGLGNIPHPDRYFAGVHFHDADRRLYGYGAPGTSLIQHPKSTSLKSIHQP